jgi:hypothetical protein
MTVIFADEEGAATLAEGTEREEGKGNSSRMGQTQQWTGHYQL